MRVRKHWRLLCYFLHAFLVALHLILLVVATSDHAEHRIVVPFANPTWTTRLSTGLQAFYTIYAALLVFVTQRLMLSAVFSSPKKLTQIHDICGAWAGLGAALSVLWQQTKVASSVLSVFLVTVYFVCISVLHVTSSTLVQIQGSNRTTTGVSPVLSTWPDASVDLALLDWTAVTPLVPFLQMFYPNRTFGLDNDTLYDTPDVGFLTATVYARTLNTTCGLLTNLSIDALEDNAWNVNASMSGLDPIGITVSYPPLLDEIWFSPSIECLPESICSTFILYLVSTEIEVDDSIGGINHVYINGTYYSPGGAIPNFSSPIYFAACSLNATNHTIILDSSGYPLASGKQPADAAWSTFLPAGDANLTSAISYAMKSANSLPPSPYCQPIMSDPALWASITVLNAYTRSALGMAVSPCYGVPIPQYTSSPSLLTRSQLESTVSQITAEFIWLAGQLGKAAGGFDRQKLEYSMPMTMSSYRLNINILPVILALCASVILLVLVLCVLWGRRMTAVSGDGVLEIMWFGSSSRALRDRLSDVKTPSLDALRASALFETIFWARTPDRHEENNVLYSVSTSRDQETCSRSPSSLQLSEPESGNFRSTPSVSHVTRHWCYALHVVLVGLHVTLLALLVHHPEESIFILYESDSMTIGLSALLQAIYTLYSAVLVLLMQQLALLKIVSEQRKLTTVNDVSRAWTGIGAAAHMLWQQRKRSTSTREILAVGAYLIMMLVLHITSSSIMQWQWYPVSLPVNVNVQTNLAMPDSAMNISQLGWTEIFPIVRLIQDADLSTLGLSNNTLCDVQQDDNTTVTGLINATTLTTQCGLVPNLTISYQNSEEYQINFQSGTNYGSFLESSIWKDVVHAIVPNMECIACPQTLFYLITTGLDVGESVQDPVAVGLNWTYTPSGGNPQTSTTLTYIAACSLSAQTILASASDPLGDQAPSSTNASWSVWSPGNATNISLGMAAALSKAATVSFPMFFQGNYSANFTDMDSYIMSLLGLNLTYANETSVSQSSADPFVALSPWQLENAVARTAATFLWTAGQVGESGGGFQRSVGETQGMYLASLWRLHLNTIPVLFASIASIVSLILAVIIICKGPSRHPVSISGTSVLECLWLEAQSEYLHSRLQTVEEPRLDALRAAGMFDVCLGDIGRSNHAEASGQLLSQRMNEITAE